MSQASSQNCVSENQPRYKVTDIVLLVDKIDTMMDKMDRLVETNIGLSKAIEGIADQHKTVVKWLLIVVCAIALGKGMMEVAQDIWFKPSPRTEIVNG